MLGESYFALKQYTTAISYYKRVVSGNFEKEQDAAIKIGHSYFMAKNFNLAAVEFQRYIDNYPKGKYIERAKQWKEMCANELIYKYKKLNPGIEDSNESNTSSDNENKSVKSNNTSKSNRDIYYGSDGNIAEI
jgi:tetratricopeptide (TPR) repeat protein